MVLSSNTIEEEEVVQKNGSSYTKTIEVPREECEHVPRQVAREQARNITRQELSPYKGEGKIIKNYQLRVLREYVFRFAVTFYTETIQVLYMSAKRWPNTDVC